jgi:hypothetical protein
VRPAAFAIKVRVRDAAARTARFVGQKTMYGGKRIAVGDRIFVFDSENSGGRGLVWSAVVTRAAAVAATPGVARQTPRVTIGIRRTARVQRPLGKSELRRFRTWDDGRPETELNFKSYRQATDKIVGLSAEATAFLARRF